MVGNIEQRMLLITGPGRCGSSAVAGALHAAGVHMGRDLIKPSPQLNPWGHFESKSWHKHERELLINLSANNLYPPWVVDVLFEDWTAVAAYTPTGFAVRSLSRWIDREIAEDVVLWGVKSPLWGLIYGHMSNILPPNQRAVVVHRNWHDSIDSRLRHMSALRKERVPLVAAERVHAAMLWGVDMFVAALSQSIQTLHVDYDHLLADPRTVVLNMLDFVAEDMVDVPLNEDAAIAWIRPEGNRRTSRVA